MFGFINTLSESRLLPSPSHLRKYSAAELSDLAYMYICALYVVYHSDEKWATAYARRTIQHGNFKEWRTNGTDLYMILHALMSDVELKNSEESNRFRRTLPIGQSVLTRWLHEMANGSIHAANNNALFTRLDFNFRVSNSTMKAIRRLVMDWDELKENEDEIALRRLIELFHHRAPIAEILSQLKQAKSDLKRRVLDEDDFSNFGESATGGGTGASAIATSVGGLGAGFDPNGHKGIYQDQPKPKKTKVAVLKRT